MKNKNIPILSAIFLMLHLSLSYSQTTQIPIIDVKKYCIAQAKDRTSHYYEYYNKTQKKDYNTMAKIFEFCMDEEQKSYNELKKIVQLFHDNNNLKICLSDEQNPIETLKANNIPSYSSKLMACGFLLSFDHDENALKDAINEKKFQY